MSWQCPHFLTSSVCPTNENSRSRCTCLTMQAKSCTHHLQGILSRPDVLEEGDIAYSHALAFAHLLSACYLTRPAPMQGSSSCARLGGKARYVCIAGLGKKEKATSPQEWGTSPFQVDRQPGVQSYEAHTSVMLWGSKAAVLTSFFLAARRNIGIH